MSRAFLLFKLQFFPDSCVYSGRASFERNSVIVARTVCYLCNESAVFFVCVFFPSNLAFIADTPHMILHRRDICECKRSREEVNKASRPSLAECFLCIKLWEIQVTTASASRRTLPATRIYSNICKKEIALTLDGNLPISASQEERKFCLFSSSCCCSQDSIRDNVQLRFVKCLVAKLQDVYRAIFVACSVMLICCRFLG